MQQQSTEARPKEIIVSHDSRELATILVKHHGIHAGLFDLAIEFQIGVGSVGPEPSLTVPGVAVGVRRVGLAPAAQISSTTVDAAEVNPSVKKAPAKKPAATKAPAK